MFIAIIIAIFEFIWKQRKLAVDENVSTFFFSEIHIHINIEYVESKIFTMKLKQLCVYKIVFLVEKRNQNTNNCTIIYEQSEICRCDLNIEMLIKKNTFIMSYVRMTCQFFFLLFE